MTELEQLLELSEILTDDEFKSLASTIQVQELLERWESINSKIQLKIFESLLEDEKVIDLMLNLPHTAQENILTSISQENIKSLLSRLQPDDITDFVQELSEETKKAIWASLSEEAKEETLHLLKYDEEEAAGIMTPRFLAIRTNQTIKQALDFVRRNCSSTEIINYIYIIDTQKRLKGVASIKALLSNRDDMLVTEVMDKDLVTVNASTDQEDVAKILETYALVAVPVIDDQERLLGIVTFDDVIDVIREEQTEDIYRMQGISGKNTSSYKETSPMRLVLKRTPWLIILLILGTFTTIVMERYQVELTNIVILATFLPLVIQTGGNSGGQSSTLMIRGLATGELKFRDTGKIILKELVVGLTMATSLCLAVFLIIQFRNLFASHDIFFTEITELQESFAISIAFFFVVIIANLIGAISPMIIHKMGMDPTVMSAPLMATVIDVLGLTIYFEIARLILKF
ncbi:MAG: magnesium transporter [Spirochaetales bacterium]|nr:magnesium transporter [Spirochaetales bacterium]